MKIFEWLDNLIKRWTKKDKETYLDWEIHPTRELHWPEKNEKLDWEKEWQQLCLAQAKAKRPKKKRSAPAARSKRTNTRQ